MIEKIAEKIKKNGGNLYLVGGAIRDELLGKTQFDEDYCITGLTQERFKELFPEAKWIRKSFGVFQLEKKEFALARSEIKKGIGHTEFDVMLDPEISIEEDLRRRDITINAIAKDMITGEIIDPFGGREDIENKKIRYISNHFSEDPLRVYRVARFAATLEFDVDENTIKIMRNMKQELKSLSKERVFLEFRKALIAKKPSIFFRVLKKAEVLDVHFKEIYDLIGSLQPEKYHPEGDSYEHTMQVLDKAAEYTEDETLRFAALVHDLGKGITPKESYPHHYGHDKRGVALVQNLGERIGLPSKWIKYGKVAAKEHMLGGIFRKMSPGKQVSYIERVEKTEIGLEGMQLIVNADREGRGNYKETEEEKRNSQFLEIGKECIQTINAKKIVEKYGKIEGKQFGELLHQERIAWLKQKNIDF